jgi:hypothetical protein
MDLEVRWEARDVVAAQDIKGDTGGEVFVGIEGDFICTLAGIADFGGEIWARGRGNWMGDGEGEVEGERKAHDIKAWPNVRRGRWNTNRQFFLCHD